MNYRQASELKDEAGNGTGLWHYTVTNDGRTRAEGYCSPWEVCPACEGISPPVFADADDCQACDNRGLQKKAEPCNGHDTPEGAQRHYREYVLDGATYGDKMSDQQLRCEICRAYTDGMAKAGPGQMYMHVLCDDHRDRDNLDRFLSSMSGVSAASW